MSDQTQCRHGHAWTPENTIFMKTRNPKTGLMDGIQKKQCRTCKKNSRKNVKNPRGPRRGPLSSASAYDAPS